MPDYKTGDTLTSKKTGKKYKLSKNYLTKTI